jgi:GT2 family glycosyltransferase/glycosyltransferase involved in cell wall biosynthesis
VRSALKVSRDLAADSLHVARSAQAAWQLSRAPVPADRPYRFWLEAHRLSAEKLTEQIASNAIDPRPVDITIVVLADGASIDSVEATLRSLTGQTAARWRAVLCGGDHLPVGADARITTGQLDAALQDGDPAGFVLVLRAGDLIEPDLVHELTARAYDDPTVDLIHWDDDVLDGEGRPGDPKFRPSWSPDVLLSANYLGSSFAIRRRRLQAAGGLDVERGDAAWWDLLLRSGFTDGDVKRLPRVLAHVRHRPSSGPDESVTVVRDHLARAGRAADVGWEGGSVRVKWTLPDPPHVTVIIPTRHNRAMLDVCLPSLARTEYPSFDVVIVDNGRRTPERERWYREEVEGLDLSVLWWDEPFNYSSVNNRAAETARGEVLVFLNDDTVLLDPGWLHEMVGWTRQPGVGLVGAQLIDPEGRIQHGGVVLGVSGFADNLFAGMTPGDDSLLGSTSWYRNVLSVTGACVAVERDLFRAAGGFDERFHLCGSDVVLGLDIRFQGKRNVCTPHAHVRHLESATRSTHVPQRDYFASWWRYQRWLRPGDPYFSPNLASSTPAPELRAVHDAGPVPGIASVLGREVAVFRQNNDAVEARQLAGLCRADAGLRGRVEAAHRRSGAPSKVRTVNWFVPDIDSPYYGGISTALRIADQLKREHDVENRFVAVTTPNEPFIRSALEAAFPALADSPVVFTDGSLADTLDRVPAADAAVATLWLTAYSVAHLQQVRRRFYLMQDFEPMFYPAGTSYALAEESYRLGLYGICNTDRLLDLYEKQYGGQGFAFSPAVDQTVFHANGRQSSAGDGPVRVFLYARPGHWRNCWELASLALDELKRKHGDRVHIVTAGSWARPEDLGSGIQHLGLLDYRETGELYRTCDVGVALTVSAHPSYLPLELMACGVPVVAFDNPAGDWILHHEENALRAPRTVDGLFDALDRMVTDDELRSKLRAQGLTDIAAGHADWPGALSGIYDYLCDPEGHDREGRPTPEGQRLEGRTK